MKPRGRRVRLRLSGVAEAGDYRYVVRAGIKVIGRGRFGVRAVDGVSLPGGVALRAAAR